LRKYCVTSYILSLNLLHRNAVNKRSLSTSMLHSQRNDSFVSFTFKFEDYIKQSTNQKAPPAPVNWLILTF
jgi:hypothetical protein